ncbi:MAG: hypothetical protein EBX52_14240, partial [Proteobacteria bacterium]|nr:hypothetical protein [Pseudomonadota bacterium]
MKHSALTLILGDQLFPDWTRDSPLALSKGDEVVMIEDPVGLATRFRYHKLRLLHTFVAMREFRDQLEAKKIRVHYLDLESTLPVTLPLATRSTLPEKTTRKSTSTQSATSPDATDFFSRLKRTLDGRTELRVAEISDRSFRTAIEEFCEREKIEL